MNLLPKTAYIKLIDIWMMFTMMYPFCVVTMYSTLQFLQEDCLVLGRVTPERVVTFMLKYGLPVLAIIFIIIFFMLGLCQDIAAAAAVNKTC